MILRVAKRVIKVYSASRLPTMHLVSTLASEAAILNMNEAVLNINDAAILN